MFYFDEFFQDFKREIYKNRNIKMKCFNIVLLSMAIALIVAALVIFELIGFKVIVINCLNIGLMVSFVVLAIILYILLLCKIKRENKSINFLELHKNKVTDKIIELLFSEKYKDYLENIEWMIECCNRKLNKRSTYDDFIALVKYLIGLVLPLITLALGILVKDFSVEDLFYYFAILFIGFILLSLFSSVLIPLARYIDFPDKKCLEYLKEELEFIKSNDRLNRNSD